MIRSIALALALSSSGAFAQNLSPAEEALSATLERLEDAHIYNCGHGVRPGATIVAFERVQGDDQFITRGIGNWRGAEGFDDVSPNSSWVGDHTSLRLAHDFVLLGKSSDGNLTRPFEGVISGVAVEGTCQTIKGDLLALVTTLVLGADG